MQGWPCPLSLQTSLPRSPFLRMPRGRRFAPRSGMEPLHPEYFLVCPCFAPFFFLHHKGPPSPLPLPKPHSSWLFFSLNVSAKSDGCFFLRTIPRHTARTPVHFPPFLPDSAPKIFFSPPSASCSDRPFPLLFQAHQRQIYDGVVSPHHGGPSPPSRWDRERRSFSFLRRGFSSLSLKEGDAMGPSLSDHLPRFAVGPFPFLGQVFPSSDDGPAGGRPPLRLSEIPPDF